MTQEHETGGAGNAGHVRASDAERERTVEQLRGHFEAGRLYPEELNERMEAAFSTRYRDELPALLTDLPSGGAGQEQAPGGAAGQPSGPGPWRGWGVGPPWARPGFAGPWTRGRGPFVPVLPLLAVFAVVASIGAVAHGHLPFPLMWLGVALWWFRPWNRHRRGPYGRRFGKASAPRS